MMLEEAGDRNDCYIIERTACCHHILLPMACGLLQLYAVVHNSVQLDQYEPQKQLTRCTNQLFFSHQASPCNYHGYGSSQRSRLPPFGDRQPFDYLPIDAQDIADGLVRKYYQRVAVQKYPVGHKSGRLNQDEGTNIQTRRMTVVLVLVGEHLPHTMLLCSTCSCRSGGR